MTDSQWGWPPAAYAFRRMTLSWTGQPQCCSSEDQRQFGQNHLGYFFPQEEIWALGPSNTVWGGSELTQHVLRRSLLSPCPPWVLYHPTQSQGQPQPHSGIPGPSTTSGLALQLQATKLWISLGWSALSPEFQKHEVLGRECSLDKWPCQVALLLRARRQCAC